MTIENLLIFVPTNMFRIFVNMRFVSVILTKSQSKYNCAFRFASGLFCFFITSIGYIIYNSKEVNIFTNILGLLCMALTFQGNTKKKFLSVFIIYAFNMLSDVVIITTFYDYGFEFSELQGTMTVLLITICEIFAERIIYIKKHPNYIAPHWAILLLIPLCSIIMINLSLTKSYLNKSSIGSEGIGLLIINIISFFLYSAMEKTYISNAENEVIIQTSKIYEQQLGIIMNTQDQIRSLQHDMKYHIRELLSFANSKDMKQIIPYLEAMQKDVNNPDEYVYSGNKVIDGNLNYFLHHANQKLSNVSAKIAIPDNDYISTFDVNIIISNLLDNAITAAEKSVDKFLYVEMFAEKSLLYINIENSYNGIIYQENGIFYSVKPDKDKHGLGLKNVQRIVKKYNGTIEMRYTDTRFYTDIMLYISNEKQNLNID